MPYQINIANIKINGVTQNGNIDVGPTVHNSHTANSKYFGAKGFANGAGGFEYNLVLIAVSIGVALIGSGAYALHF